MSRVIVSILSNHSIPNFLFFKEMTGKYDEFLFITTPEIDKLGREEQLVNALSVNVEDEGCICVDGNDYKSILAELNSQWPVRDGDEYIVNLTGGTKMMSLAVHDFFAAKGAQFYYVPIGKNIYYNLNTGEKKLISYRANLKEYFTLYGIRYNSVPESEFGHSADEAMDIYKEVSRRRFHLPYRLTHAHEAETSDMRHYLSGEWFEQFSYYKIKDAFNLDEDHIAQSLKIFRNNGEKTNDNELDVAFMYENALYVIECKVSMNGWTGGGKEPKLVVGDYLYKLAAISKDFGLQVKPYLFTLHNMEKFSEDEKHSFVRRCHILGISGIVSGKLFHNIKSSLFNKQQLDNL